MQIEMSEQFLIKFSNIKFNQNQSIHSHSFMCTDGQMERFNWHSAGLLTCLEMAKLPLHLSTLM
jgi:hypothetical protein